MVKLISHTVDRCSYPLHMQRHHARMQRRHQLLLGIWLTCSGFTWPGRVPHLSYQAAHGTVPERVEALRLLGEYPGQVSRDACLAALEDGASEVRAQAAECVGTSSDERAATNLLDLVDAEDPLERAAALEALGRLAPARALPSLERALGAPQAPVRAAGVRALQAYVRNGSFEVAKLAPLLSAEPVDVRLAAVEVLRDASELAHAAATTRVLQLQAAARDPSAEVRMVALRAMGRTGDAKLLRDLSAALSDSDESVRLSAIAALGDSNLPGATSPLRGLVSDGQELRAARTALAALGRISDPSALPPIAAALMRTELAHSAALAMVARAKRLNQPETYLQSVAALQRAIEAPPHTTPKSRTDSLSHAAASDGSLDALAGAVLELAPFCDVRPAFTSLVRVLEAGRGEVYAITQRLLALSSLRHSGVAAAQTQGAREHSSNALLMAALLQRDATTSPRLADALIAVLVASADPRALLTAHHEALLRVADARPAQTSGAIKLHALMHAGESDASLDARRALAALWADQPALAAQQDHLGRLVRWLDDADKEVREHSSVVLGGAADTATLGALNERLQRGAAHSELTLRACAGAMLRTKPANALRERLLQQFQSYLSSPDETVAMSAIFALRAANEQRSAPWIAGLLRGSSPQLRAAAIQSLAGFDQPEARRMLRDMLRGDNVQNASNAALALAELGSDRDVEALLRAAERGSWPLPPSAAYAAARITARGVTRKHSLERVLCRFAGLRDSYVLSNIVSALAALGADACDDQIRPEQLLDLTLPSHVRAAAGLWLRSTRPHSPQESAEQRALLARCASDHDSTVAAACTPSAATPAPAGQTLLHVFEADARSALRNRVIALRHPDGSVFVGQTDNTGRIYLPRPAPGELRVEDPADQGPLALPARSARTP